MITTILIVVVLVFVGLPIALGGFFLRLIIKKQFALFNILPRHQQGLPYLLFWFEFLVMCFIWGSIFLWIINL